VTAVLDTGTEWIRVTEEGGEYYHLYFSFGGICGTWIKVSTESEHDDRTYQDGDDEFTMSYKKMGKLYWKMIRQY
jgi:hypothetical protein